MRTMVDMARDSQEIKRDMPTAAKEPSGPVYDYGLCITLNEDSLAKLGMGDDLPSIDDMMHGTFMAKVTSVSENQMQTPDGPKTCCRVEMQITHIGVENENTEYDNEERAERRYGGKGAE